MTQQTADRLVDAVTFTATAVPVLIISWALTAYGPGAATLALLAAASAVLGTLCRLARARVIDDRRDGAR